jgi:hypothetical protein
MFFPLKLGAAFRVRESYATWIIATAQGRRLLHDNESVALQKLHDPMGHNRRHVLIGVVDTLPAAELQSESNRAGNVATVGAGDFSSSGVTGR